MSLKIATILTLSLWACVGAKFNDIHTLSSSEEADQMLDNLLKLVNEQEYYDVADLEDLEFSYKPATSASVRQYRFTDGKLSEIVSRQPRRVTKSQYTRNEGGYTVRATIRHRRLRVSYDQVQVQGRTEGSASSPALRAQFEEVRAQVTLRYYENGEFMGLNVQKVQLTSVGDEEVEVRRGTKEQTTDAQLEKVVGQKLRPAIEKALKEKYQEFFDRLREYHA